MTDEQIKQRAEDFIVIRQNHTKYYSGEAVKILLKNFAEEIVAEATKELQEKNAELKRRNGEVAGQKASLERWFGEAKSIIREYIRLSLQEDTDIDANVKLFQKAEAFLKE